MLIFLSANPAPCLSCTLNCQSNCKQGKPIHTQVRKRPCALIQHHLDTPPWRFVAVFRLALLWLWWEVPLSPLGWYWSQAVASSSQHVCPRVYCWFCCWQSNTGLSAPVRADPLISMETRKPADINQRQGHSSETQQGDVAALMLRVEICYTVQCLWYFRSVALQKRIPFLSHPSLFLGKYMKRYLSACFGVGVWRGSILPTVTWFTDTHTLLAVSTAVILMA